ncbi:MAG TPA: PQQ-like beta-propeller repeat protein, partial [Candidatus Nocardiopsis merdipullorum]|nr:PQQ-like beta-propeller repeat protein [Candidatus Nocardiopsis merdipullorum]
MKSSVAVAAVAVLLLSSCSVTEEMGQWFAGLKEEEWEPIQDLEYPTSVSEVAWRWEVPEGNDTPRVGAIPVTGGVGAVLDDGIIALSAETGGEMWSYQVSGSEVFKATSSDGRYFVLQIMDSEDEDAPPRMIILDLETGEPVEDYLLGGGA